jgi:hypothetical protein
MDAMLDELAASFRKYEGGAMPVALLPKVDHALAAAMGERGTARSDALIGLVGIRRGLFPEAPAYQPERVDHAGSVAA